MTTTPTPTPPLPCLILPFEDGDGPANMARDEALLDLVTREPGSAALRTYGWTEPTLSLGYFQTLADARADPRWRDVPVVRRPTGGGAIWHDRELTYALAVPRSHPLARQSGDLYRGVHEAIAGLLRESGVDARRRGGSADPGAGADRVRPFLCFNDRDADDLLIGPRKVVGSSQRRRAGAILQHGSFLLSGSPRAPELAGAADLAAVPGDAASWSDRLRRRLPEALGFLPVESDGPAAWRARARELERSVYRDPAWTGRR